MLHSTQHACLCLTVAACGWLCSGMLPSLGCLTQYKLLLQAWASTIMACWHHVLLAALVLAIVGSGAAQDVSLGGLAIEPMSVGTQMQDLSVFPASPVAGDTIYITGRLVRWMQLPVTASFSGFTCRALHTSNFIMLYCLDVAVCDKHQLTHLHQARRARFILRRRL
jgi:hypothetical protein